MPDLVTEAATATWIGARNRQEDAVMAHVRPGEETGLIVLSDGMGGHCDGDIASRAIVSEVLGDLFLAACRPDALRVHGGAFLRRAATAANARLRDHAADGLGEEGMGGTLVSGILLDGTLRWISVGDSPLYLWRGGRLSRLNADHSLAPQIDLMAAEGALDPEEARCHPQRGVLTSALTGGPIAKIDCPEEAFVLAPGDLLIFASDGLAALSEEEIAALMARHRRRPAQQIADRLMAAVTARADSDQDNVSIAVVTVAARPGVPAHPFADRLSGWRAALGRVGLRPGAGGLRP